eukprot:m.85275 g.85275  ORF g.85275 m.85275 type:complete len:57 (-) comp14838_c2_seq2:108-278(-)
MASLGCQASCLIVLECALFVVPVCLFVFLCFVGLLVFVFPSSLLSCPVAGLCLDTL